MASILAKVRSVTWTARLIVNAENTSASSAFEAKHSLLFFEKKEAEKRKKKKHDRRSCPASRKNDEDYHWWVNLWLCDENALWLLYVGLVNLWRMDGWIWCWMDAVWYGWMVLGGWHRGVWHWVAGLGDTGMQTTPRLAGRAARLTSAHHLRYAVRSCPLLLQRTSAQNTTYVPLPYLRT